MFDYNSYEQWYEEGGLDTYARAGRVYKKVLNEYVPPALDAEIDEALQAFIQERKAEIQPEY